MNAKERELFRRALAAGQEHEHTAGQASYGREASEPTAAGQAPYNPERTASAHCATPLPASHPDAPALVNQPGLVSQPSLVNRPNLVSQPPVPSAAVPAPPALPADFAAEVMARIARERSLREARTERRTLQWSISLAVLVGGGALWLLARTSWRNIDFSVWQDIGDAFASLGHIGAHPSQPVALLAVAAISYALVAPWVSGWMNRRLSGKKL